SRLVFPSRGHGSRCAAQAATRSSRHNPRRSQPRLRAPSASRRQSRSSRATNQRPHSSQQASAGSSYHRSSVVSFRLAFNNPTLPENTDGYETQLHHVPGRDPGRDQNPSHGLPIPTKSLPPSNVGTKR